MKNLMKIMMLVAVAAMSFVSCSNEFEDVNVKNETFELVISAEKPALESDSRTEFNNGSIIWSASDQIRACYYHSTGVWSKYYASTTNNISADGSTATFSGINDFPAVSGEGTYTFYAGYPKNAIGGGNTAAPNAGELSVELPTKQNMPKLGTFDANADIMLGVAQDVVAAPVTEISVRWYRMVAHGCVTLKNLPAEEGETIYTVTFTAPESVKLSGNGTINFVDEAMSDLDNNTVAVTLPTNTAAKFTELPVWFCSAPATIAAGANLTIAVETTRGTYTRTITARDGGIKFMQNRYNTLSVDMASAEFKAAEVSTDVWAQVTSLADVTAGTYVIVGDGFYCPNDAIGGNGQPLAKTIASNNVSIADGKLVGTVADGMKWTFSGTADAMTITKFGSSDKLYVTNTNNGVKIGAGDGLAWNIVDNGDGTFTLKYPLSDVRRLTLYYTSGAATDWRCYKMTTEDQDGARLSTLSLYQLQAPADPDAPTLSVDKSELTFAVEGGSQTVTATTTNYDGAITASSNNSHFTVSVSGNVVTVTAPANEESTEQTATITIKAGDLSKSVAVSQAAKEVVVENTATATFNMAAVNPSFVGPASGNYCNYEGNDAFWFDDVENSNIALVFVKGTYSYSPSYNTNYKNTTINNGNKLIVEGKTIVKIEFTFSSSSKGALTADNGTYASGVWTGESNCVTFTGTTNATYITNMVVTYKADSEGVFTNSKSPQLVVVEQPERVAYEGANVTVALTVRNLTAAITATPSANWITNAAVSGSNLTFTVAANESTEDRSATITLTSGSVSTTVSVNQAGKPAAGATVSTFVTDNKFSLTNSTLTASDGVVSIVIEKNTSTANVALYTPLRFYKNHKMTFTVADSKKITKIVFNYNDGKPYKALTINTGSGTFNLSGAVGTYTCSGESTIAFVAPDQVRFESIEVTYQ